MNRAIVLLSGGMDSLVSAAIAHRDCDELFFLHISYGQRTEAKERWCFEQLARHYHAVEARVVDYHWLSAIGGSALTDPNLEIPEGITQDTNTYVPFRNATFLCAAVAWAEVINATRIYIGAVEEDSSGYPDCRESFFEAMNAVIQEGTKAKDIAVYTPVIHLNKSEIVKLGMSLKAPFVLSWSCYGQSVKACGTCPSCILRLRAFEAAGLADPIDYEGKS